MQVWQYKNTLKHLISGILALVMVTGLVIPFEASALEVNDMNPVSWFSSDDSRAEKKAKEAYLEAQEELREAKMSVLVAKEHLKSAETRQKSAEEKVQTLKTAWEKLAGSGDKKTENQPVQTEAPKQVAKTPVTEKEDGSKLNPTNWFKSDKDDSAVQMAAVEDKDSKKKDEATQAKGLAAIIKTEKGDIAIELFPDEAPITVANFVNLIRTGFYNQPGLKFHRVVPGFVIQTGDPTGTGAGGSKERIPLEVKNKLSHDEAGVVAMARGPSPHSATSQFYITLAEQKNLDGKYAIFGHVIKGLDVVKNINQGDKFYGAELVDVASVEPDPKAEKDSIWSSWLN